MLQPALQLKHVRTLVPASSSCYEIICGNIYLRVQGCELGSDVCLCMLRTHAANPGLHSLRSSKHQQRATPRVHAMDFAVGCVAAALALQLLTESAMQLLYTASNLLVRFGILSVCSCCCAAPGCVIMLWWRHACV
jgi:hypothetical protein